MPDLTLLHTNDFHNHLTAAQAESLRVKRVALGGSGLLLDCGDAISSGNVTFRPGGEPILDLMSDARYDAMVVGNREFHFSEVGFRAKLSRARFPVLCANVRPRDPGGASPVVEAITREVAGVRVTVFGLTVPMITERMLVRKVSAFVFDDPIAVAARRVPQLRTECDLLVCLSHIGLARDRELAAKVPGIDLIIGGHTHAVLETGEQAGDTLIVQAGWYAKYVGRVDVHTDGGRPRFRATLEPLGVSPEAP